MPRKPSRLVPRAELDETKRQSMLNYFAMIAYAKPWRIDRQSRQKIHNLHFIRIGTANFHAALVTHHATTGNPLSVPVVVIVGNGNGSPQVFDAYDWSMRESEAMIDLRNQEAYNYRQLAIAVRAKLQQIFAKQPETVSAE